MPASTTPSPSLCRACPRADKVVQFRNALGDPSAPEPSHYRQSQNIKCTYVVLPLDLKMSALRYHNIRPYATAGVMGVFDVSKDRSEQLKLKNTDVMLTVGMGEIFSSFSINFYFTFIHIINVNCGRLL